MSEITYNRRGELGAIHAAKRRLGLDDDQYRDLLEEWTGKRSAAELAGAERHRVIERFRRLGFERLPDEPQVGGDDDGPTAKIKQLWVALHRAGAVKNPSEQALNAWVKRQTGVSHVRWLRPRQQATVIESLKKWLDRLPPTPPRAA